jgi:hypothetical protein
MSKTFEAHQMTFIAKTLWFAPGRVVTGEIELGDVLHPDVTPGADQLLPNCKVMAIETYGEAIDFLSEGTTGGLVIQVPHTEADAFMQGLPSVVLLKTED